MFNWKSMKFGTKITLLAIGSVLLTALAFVALTAWQSTRLNAIALEQIDNAIDDDLSHLAQSIYNMAKAQDASAQRDIDLDLNVAHDVFGRYGDASLVEETVEWKTVNQYTLKSTSVQLPKMTVGGEWLGQNDDFDVETPIVDEVEELVGSTTTIFQRINEAGDMLRVATSVPTKDGTRAVGTYIPATNPDGTPNPVVSTVMNGQVYHGQAYVVNAWYVTAYEPIRDDAGEIIGMLYVGVKRDDVIAPLRQAIIDTKVGDTGYVYVLGGKDEDMGHYIISQNGERDGEDIWDTQDAEGNYMIHDIVNTALALEPGELGTERYPWQNPSDPEPRWKVARLAYYEPWDWVIGASTYEDELQHYRETLQAGQTRMLVTAAGTSMAIALIVGFLGLTMARSLTRPMNTLTRAAEALATGELEQTVPVESQDELGTLASVFNQMTERLREMIDSLQARTRAVEASAEVSRRLSTILDETQLATEVVEQLQQAFGFYHAHIYLVDEDSGDLMMAGGTGIAGRAMLADGHRISQGRGLVGRAANTNTTVLVSDVSQDRNWLPNPLLPDTKAEVAVPITVGERVLGVLDVQHNVTDGLSDDDADLLAAIANQVAVALQNTRLFTEAQERARYEERVNLITQRIQSTTTVEEALQIAVREVGQALKAGETSVRLVAGTQPDNGREVEPQLGSHGAAEE